MASIVDLWNSDRELLKNKTVQQILAFSGEGKLKDNSSTSFEFRKLLDIIPSQLLTDYGKECLAISFQDSGFVLQDIVNQIGVRLGFEVENGFYRGKKNDIGYDGIWKSNSGYHIVVEVKTTDAYRINLNTHSKYREELITANRINKNNSSILIIVGRQDTGDLEAQIRGSRHAWDIKLLSFDSLIKLLVLRESINDRRTLQQINEVLKPFEYTRIDKLIDLIFLTSQDIQLSEETEDEIESIATKVVEGKEVKEKRFTPVNFHDECIEKIEDHLNLNFIKQTKISYETKNKEIGIICAISKEHKQGKNVKYWFAFHPHQDEFLKEYRKAYVAYGCGSANQTFLIPYKKFRDLVANMWTTEKEDRMYWHVVIHKRGKKFQLAQPNNKKENLLEINNFKI